MSRRSAEEIASALLDVDRLVASGQPLATAVANVGVSTTTYYRWRRTFDGMSKEGVRRIRDLERENQRLRRIVADKALEIEFLREVSRGTY
jgi:hypothetical protein